MVSFVASHVAMTWRESARLATGRSRSQPKRFRFQDPSANLLITSKMAPSKHLMASTRVMKKSGTNASSRSRNLISSLMNGRSDIKNINSKYCTNHRNQSKIELNYLIKNELN